MIALHVNGGARREAPRLEWLAEGAAEIGVRERGSGDRGHYGWQDCALSVIVHGRSLGTTKPKE